MNITYVITRAHPIGGAQIHVRDLAVSLQAQGHTCSVVTGGTGLFVDMLRAERVPTTILRHLILPIHPVHDALALREIHRALATLRPDLVAAHSSKAGILSRIAARMLGIPVILTAHGWNFTPGIASAPAYMYRQFERWAGPLTSKIIAVSEYDRQLALQAGIVAEEKVVTVYNGMGDIGPELRAQPGQTPVRLVMVARFGAQKDHPTLLRALAGLLDLPWEIDLIGDGELMAQTQALAAELGLSNRIHFLGQRRDVDLLLARAQVEHPRDQLGGIPAQYSRGHAGGAAGDRDGGGRHRGVGAGRRDGVPGAAGGCGGAAGPDSPVIDRCNTSHSARSGGPDPLRGTFHLATLRAEHASRVRGGRGRSARPSPAPLRPSRGAGLAFQISQFDSTMPSRGCTCGIVLQHHPQVGPVHPVSGGDQAQVRLGVLGLAADGDPAHPLAGRGAVQRVEQPIERAKVPRDQLEDADLVLGAAGRERRRVPECESRAARRASRSSVVSPMPRSRVSAISRVKSTPGASSSVSRRHSSIRCGS